LAQAIELTGRSRRSLYRDMDAGRVSYRVSDDGRRELETSELIRAYGPLRAVAQLGTQRMAQSGTPVGTPPIEPGMQARPFSIEALTPTNCQPGAPTAFLAGGGDLPISPLRAGGSRLLFQDGIKKCNQHEKYFFLSGVLRDE